MTALTYLTRIDPQQNMARFYRLDIQPTLFGEWALIREWGRIGSSGRLRINTFGTPEAASVAMAQMTRVKVRRGYQLE